MDSNLLVAALIGCVSLLYATAGQAGGTAFLAIMAFAAFPADHASDGAPVEYHRSRYATWRLHRLRAIDHYKLLLKVTLPSLVTASPVAC